MGLTPQLEQRVKIHFGVKLGWTFVQMKTALTTCYGANVLSDRRIYYWMREFHAGCQRIVDLHHAPKAKTGRSRANIRQIESFIAEDRRSTIHSLVAKSGLRYSTIQKILKKVLKLTKKCAKYVPVELTDAQKLHRFTVANFWSRLFASNRCVFANVVTMDESWIYLCDPDSKEASGEWLCRDENHLQKAHQSLATGRIMLLSFFNSHGMIYFDFVRHPQTVNEIKFRQIFTQFDIAYQNRRPRGVVQGRHFLHFDNTPAHTAFLTRQHIRQLGWTCIPHPPYSPDMMPNDFWLYPRLKKPLKGHRFRTLNELEDAVRDEIGRITCEEYHHCMLTHWPTRWRRCLAAQGTYFEGMQ